MTHRDLKNLERELHQRGYRGEPYFGSKISYVWKKDLYLNEEGSVQVSMRIQTWDHSETNDVNPCSVEASVIVTAKKHYETRTSITIRERPDVDRLEKAGLLFGEMMKKTIKKL